MLPLYGSFVFAYAGVFMSHVLAGALLVGSYIFLQRRTHPVLCGFSSAWPSLRNFLRRLRCQSGRGHWTTGRH